MLDKLKSLYYNKILEEDSHSHFFVLDTMDILHESQ